MWTYLGINFQWRHIHPHHPYALLDPGGRASALGVVRIMAVRSKQYPARVAMACVKDTAAASAANMQGATRAQEMPLSSAGDTAAASAAQRQGAARALRAPLSCASDTAAASAAKGKGATRALRAPLSCAADTAAASAAQRQGVQGALGATLSSASDTAAAGAASPLCAWLMLKQLIEVQPGTLPRTPRLGAAGCSRRALPYATAAWAPCTRT